MSSFDVHNAIDRKKLTMAKGLACDSQKKDAR
jgi:hypothetical protein